jgi:hypothetical protein
MSRGSSWNRGLDGRGEVACGAERAPHHDELSDAAGPSLFAVIAKDSLELGLVVPVDYGRGGQLGGRVHAHVERSVGAEAEPARGVVDLRAGKTEVEEDQVSRLEALLRRD